ncbi:MAG: hypothetical protein AB2754_09105 [Candidatus Thiodiazotropha endolucinida]
MQSGKYIFLTLICTVLAGVSGMYAGYEKGGYHAVLLSDIHSGISAKDRNESISTPQVKQHELNNLLISVSVLSYMLLEQELRGSIYQFHPASPAKEINNEPFYKELVKELIPYIKENSEILQGVDLDNLRVDLSKYDYTEDQISSWIDNHSKINELLVQFKNENGIVNENSK